MATPVARLRRRSRWLIASLPFRSKRTIELRVFAASGFQQMRHPHRLAAIRSEEGSLQRNIADVSAGHLQSRQPCEVEPVGGRLVRKGPAPDLRALGRIRKRKADDESQTAQEGSIDRPLD